MKQAADIRLCLLRRKFAEFGLSALTELYLNAAGLRAACLYAPCRLYLCTAGLRLLIARTAELKCILQQPAAAQPVCGHNPVVKRVMRFSGGFLQ